MTHWFCWFLIFKETLGLLGSFTIVDSQDFENLFRFVKSQFAEKKRYCTYWISLKCVLYPLLPYNLKSKGGAENLEILVYLINAFHVHDLIVKFNNNCKNFETNIFNRKLYQTKPLLNS